MPPFPSRSKRQPSTTSIPPTPEPRGTPVTLQIYDLLPPSRLSTLLYTIGTSLHHSALLINDLEYAYGGHSVPHKTGVWSSPPGTVPPGGTFRCSVLQGHTTKSKPEIEAVIRDVSAKFSGTKYNLLTQNCNHFTSALSTALLNKPTPSWVNRAAGIGVALPCMVPREWVQPPGVEDVEGELVDNEGREGYREESDDERAAMLDFDRGRRRVGNRAGMKGTPPARVVRVRVTGKEDGGGGESVGLPRRFSLGG
ncbi:hypothetical protein B0A48_02713 [Cryoendolithus antarcticus]|uniref:PPPDE domain-containing protein n=1 Tax=Cryoendolithus antarcticus TaxID=1507870 RepID=A0A1V8TL81_9PEZI|nr:hypothetical protein B0A48_02713 [Cryoendolithus antarcticus]